MSHSKWRHRLATSAVPDAFLRRCSRPDRVPRIIDVGVWPNGCNARAPNTRASAAWQRQGPCLLLFLVRIPPVPVSHHMPRGGGGRPRRSKRISAEANSAPSPPGEHGGDDDDDDRTKPQAPKKAARASRPRRRSARNAAGTAAAEFNLGPDRPPIFLLSQELLKKIWTFLDSKTKMTSTVSDFLWRVGMF